jgi:hypothetical protein
MKGTKIMLAVLGTLITSWLLLGLIAYLTSDFLSYKQATTHGATLFSLLTFGWIPAIIVGADLDKKLES